MNESQKRAIKKYKQSKYEKICIDYPIGTRENWKQEAKKRGLSLAEFIRLAVQAYLSK